MNIAFKISSRAAEMADMTLLDVWGVLVAAGYDTDLMERTDDEVIVYEGALNLRR